VYGYTILGSILVCGTEARSRCTYTAQGGVTDLECVRDRAERLAITCHVPTWTHGILRVKVRTACRGALGPAQRPLRRAERALAVRRSPHHTRFDGRTRVQSASEPERIREQAMAGLVCPFVPFAIRAIRACKCKAFCSRSPNP
jgi:hypothetical protein